MPEPLLRIRNVHVAACGDPPILTNDDPQIYVGYFANTFGEQWLFTYDRRTKEAELRGGDVGWPKSYPVADGQVVGDLLLNPPELMWLAACWKAACGA